MRLYSHALVGLCVLVCINAEDRCSEAGQICPTTGSSMLQKQRLQEKSELDRQNADEKAPTPEALPQEGGPQFSGRVAAVSGECRDTDDRCGTKWKGMCDKIKVSWRCRKSCNLCDVCMDWVKNCQTKWKDKCSQKNAQEICPLTCGVCSKTTPVPTLGPTSEPAPACEEKTFDAGIFAFTNMAFMPMSKQPSAEACLATCNGCYGVTYVGGKLYPDYYQNCYVYQTSIMAGAGFNQTEADDQDHGVQTYVCRAPDDPVGTPCKATFIDMASNKYENLDPLTVVDDVWVFGVWDDENKQTLMAGVDRKGFDIVDNRANETQFSRTSMSNEQQKQLWNNSWKSSQRVFFVFVTKYCEVPTLEPTSAPVPKVPCQVSFTTSSGKLHEGVWYLTSVDNVWVFGVWTGFASELVGVDRQGVVLESRGTQTQFSRNMSGEQLRQLWKSAFKTPKTNAYKAKVTKFCEED